MIHAREDYNRIQDPALHDPSLLGNGSTPIGKDEPVFLLRAQDKHFLQMLAAYGWQLDTDQQMDPAERQKMQRLLAEHTKRALKWRTVSPDRVKTPDLPRED